MKQITLAHGKIQTSNLGFGCSGLMGAGTEVERIRLLSSVFDAGVSHFDVAPYYGYGEAEEMLGKFTRSRRDRLTITTKFGIQPPPKSTKLKTIVGIARQLAKLNPWLRKVLSKQAGRLIQTQAFGISEAQKSLDNSLRELKTDYIDIYLLHDCKLADTQSEELLSFLQDAVRDGKIRTFGIGTEIEQVKTIANSQPQFTQIMQFEHNLIERNLEKIEIERSQGIITHRAIASNFHQLLSFFQASSNVVQWSKKLELNLADSTTLAQLMLNYAVQTNSNGIVLFSSQKSNRADRNIRSVSESFYTSDQINQFAELVQKNYLN